MQIGKGKHLKVNSWGQGGGAKIQCKPFEGGAFLGMLVIYIKEILSDLSGSNKFRIWHKYFRLNPL